jgi:hypothetical protein
MKTNSARNVSRNVRHLFSAAIAAVVAGVGGTAHASSAGMPWEGPLSARCADERGWSGGWEFLGGEVQRGLRQAMVASGLVVGTSGVALCLPGAKRHGRPAVNGELGEPRSRGFPRCQEDAAIPARRPLRLSSEAGSPTQIGGRQRCEAPAWEIQRPLVEAKEADRSIVGHRGGDLRRPVAEPNLSATDLDLGNP